MSKTENLIKGLGFINGAIPGIAKIIVTLSSGHEIDLTELTKKTKDIVDAALKEAAAHLAKE